MPIGIYNRKLSKPNNGIFKRGNIPWDKGVKRPPFSDECIRKMKEAGVNKRIPETQREKMSESAKNHWKNPLERIRQSERQKGKRGSGWKGGISHINKILRVSIEFRLWREAVFARDNWICQKTGIKGGKLHPHHIKNFAQYPELRFAIDNGITLSERAHKKFHKIYGTKNNNEIQLKEFINKGER